jgi:cytochrome P450
MSFLASYAELPAQDPKAQVGAVYKALRGDWRALFAELRRDRPVFASPAFVMVTRHADVIDVLAQPDVYSVRGYGVKMDPSVGPFMLGRDRTQINWHDKAVMRSVLRFEDLPRVRKLAGDAARGALDEAGETVDLVPAVGRLVPLRIVQQYFGFTGPDDATMLRWSVATQTDMFRNPFNDPAVHQANIAAGNEMRAWLREALATSRPARSPDRPEHPVWPVLRWLLRAPPPMGRAEDEAQGDDAFSRLQRMMHGSDAPFADQERLVSNVAGLLVGAIETTSQAIVQASEQILRRPEVRAQAEAAARADDLDRFDEIVWEALRFNPITVMVLRYAERDTVLAPGSERATPVSKGTVVAACIGSAMFDEDVVAEPDSFRPGRPDSRLFHLGFGHHECLGRHVGLQMVPEAVRQILLTPGIALIDGPEGQIDFAGTAYPEHFRVRKQAP